MTNPEKLFERELEVFRTEAQAGAQFFYAFLTIKTIMSDKKSVLKVVNCTPLFWSTNIGALQTSFFIVLGRIFDQDSKHNVGSLLRIAQDNAEIFSKEFLADRKRRDSPNADEWLEEYLRESHVPTKEDFRELRKQVKEYRKIYETSYRDIRSKIYAHKEIVDLADVQALFSKTRIRELQKIFMFVNALYEALWQLFQNGAKPKLRSTRYSIKSIIRNPAPGWHIQTIQERMVKEVTDFFRLLESA